MAIAIFQKSFHSLLTKKQSAPIDNKVFGSKIGITASLFGCWHEQISRPFNDGKSAYRACLECGARQPFDTETLRTASKFYYPPIVRNIEIK